MILNTKEYEERLKAYSQSTMQLIMDLNHLGKEAASKKTDIVSNSELTEEQVVEQLKKLKQEYLKKTKDSESERPSNKRLHGEEYSRRLEEFSNYTLVLISTIHGTSREIVQKSHDITTDSDLTEEQVIKKLLELIRSCPDCSPYVTYSEALKIVCEALAEGHVASLYEIVERDADLVFVDEDKCISGERDIFNFLVQERLEYIYESRRKTITCDILRVVEGERYGVGERCILRTYQLKDGTMKKHIIKVHFANSKIYKLEIFNPYGPLRLVDEKTFNET